MAMASTCLRGGDTVTPYENTRLLGGMHDSLESTKQRLSTISMANHQLSGFSVTIPRPTVLVDVPQPDSL
ncbi:hypothetical protein N7449_003007 [Penicillium cf. viridicatum]|uniref:Uncharacterized protein n=1 Tax=Penicillium cf. viridicatum TaxID=2972119 RepID=A0A9W9MWJ4_9EURO|nr:hypothetical protein N7449_003007 [Penicillium cf. viridicatum]